MPSPLCQCAIEAQALVGNATGHRTGLVLAQQLLELANAHGCEMADIYDDYPPDEGTLIPYTGDRS